MDGMDERHLRRGKSMAGGVIKEDSERRGARIGREARKGRRVWLEQKVFRYLLGSREDEARYIVIFIMSNCNKSSLCYQ